MLHLSDIKKYERCNKLYHLSTTERKRNSFFSFFHPFENMDKLVKTKLNISRSFEGVRNDATDKTLGAMKEHEWIINGRFEYRTLRVKIPYMQQVSSKWNIYFLILQHYPTQDKAKEFAYNIEILKKQGININNVFIIHLNKEYVRDGELNANEFLTVTDCFYNQKGNLSFSIVESIDKCAIDVDSIIDEITSFNYVDEKIKKEPKCTRGTKCDYFNVCFPDYDVVDDNSILHLVSSQNKYEMYDNNITELIDVDLDRVEGTRMQYAQVMASRQSDGFFMDQLALKCWFQTLVNDKICTFLDFEWDIYCVPPYDGMSPLQVLPFQYSIHTYSNWKIDHREFLGLYDCREELIKQLLEDIPDEGPIFAYNAKGAEALRLKELGMSFPQYEQELTDIINRLEDLSIPFETGLIYDLRMRGLFSLKALSNMLHPEDNYDDLSVSNGLEAVRLHRELEKISDNEVSENIRKQLLEYCSKDTSELLSVYLWIKEKCGIL